MNFSKTIRYVLASVGLFFLASQAAQAQSTDTAAATPEVTQSATEATTQTPAVAASEATATTEATTTTAGESSESKLKEMKDSLMGNVAAVRDQVQDEVADLLEQTPTSIIEFSGGPLTSTHVYTIGGGILTGAVLADLFGGGGLFTLVVATGGGLVGNYMADMMIEKKSEGSTVAAQ